ncbi:antA/AntB antirepressor family protein [Lactococcus petauri]|uniref:antA/AntB antirepressor family protein n=1 Tax=Lactococcus petauri TaxID=1940789 RepID=UPI0038525B04
MNQLINITQNENNESVVSGRELHEFLEVGTAYKDWFPRMLKYGFVENIDFVAIAQKRATAQGNQTEYTDHALKLDMAKEISMIQRTAKGKEARQYFIQVEKAFKQQPQIPTTQRELAQLALAANEETAQRMDVVESKLQDLEENKLITTEDKGTIDSYVRKKVSTICRDQHLDSEARSLLFQDLGSSIKKLFNVPNRGRIKDKDFLQVLDFVSTWEPSSVTKAKINQLHIQ